MLLNPSLKQQNSSEFTKYTLPVLCIVVKPEPNYLLWPSTTRKNKTWTNQNSKQILLVGVKRGNTRAGKSRLLLVLHLIGWESGASNFYQSLSVVKQNQSNHVSYFDTKLKNRCNGLLNPLSPNSDKHVISPYSITTWSNIQVMRIKEMMAMIKCLNFWSNSPN